MLPSGGTVFSNRVHWAKTYLAQAKLLEITRRAHFRLTDRGRSLLAENPPKIDVRLLERYPEFNEFKTRSRKSQGQRDTVTSETPEEGVSHQNEKSLPTLMRFSGARSQISMSLCPANYWTGSSQPRRSFLKS